MNKLSVNTQSKNYHISFYDSFNHLNEEIIRLNKSFSKIAIIADSNVYDLYVNDVKTHLEKNFKEIFTYKFDAGEDNKNLNTISNFYDFMINNKLDRKSLLVALGGGVTGDMVGFLAATYMRGISFIQIPTSLLAQVDSSTGGKTGVDFKGYKNLVGAFYQPELVYINTNTLKTLPEQEFNSGMAEALKHGLIRNKSYYGEILNNVISIKNLEHNSIVSLVKQSCEIKSEIVSNDEIEQGLRMILNFGHTAGHAIEKLKNFSLLHGECVALGIIVASEISKSLGHMSDEELALIYEGMALYNLPTSISDLSAETIYEEMFYDKKTLGNKLQYVLLNKIGECYISIDLSKDIIIDALTKIIRD